MNRPEQSLQIAVAAYLGHALKPPTIWTAFPAGGGGRTRGAFLKAMGLKAGWPDILVIAPGPWILGIELKAKAGRSSPAQLAIAEQFRAAGMFYEICRSVEEVERDLFLHGIPLSASVGRAAGPESNREILSLTVQPPARRTA